MIRRAIIVVLTLGAVGTVVLDIVSRQRPLLYFCDHIVQPTFWKLYTAQADHGKLRIAFESLGETVDITEQDLPSGVPHRILKPKQRTLRDRLTDKGFSVHTFALWSYGSRWDGAGSPLHTKAMRRAVSFASPAWFLFILLASYPTIALIRGPLRRWRWRRKGLCTKCNYNLTGNTSGVCPECGNEFDGQA